MPDLPAPIGAPGPSLPSPAAPEAEAEDTPLPRRRRSLRRTLLIYLLAPWAPPWR
ncbi:hypothetical protein [Oryzomicrobium sp.]|uniref:hypothetical protein n=1 Tax=Oryzomicrobium sp. TaxID=1911578 RepID=UPI002FE073A4